MKYQLGRKQIVGLTLIELMIAVVIVGLLAAAAIPVYLDYLRRSYLNEATASIASIKSAEESYFNLHGCYVSAQAHPSSIPSGSAEAWDPAPAVWSNSGLAIRPDRLVRFQYMVYASNSWSASTSCDAPAGAGSLNSRTDAIGCVANPSAVLVNATVFPRNWYIVVARGDLDRDGVASNIISAVDDSRTVMCNEIE